jgi:hypothetical protein
MAAFLGTLAGFVLGIVAWVLVGAPGSDHDEVDFLAYLLVAPVAYVAFRTVARIIDSISGARLGPACTVIAALGPPVVFVTLMVEVFPANHGPAVLLASGAILGGWILWSVTIGARAPKARIEDLGAAAPEIARILDRAQHLTRADVEALAGALQDRRTTSYANVLSAIDPMPPGFKVALHAAREDARAAVHAAALTSLADPPTTASSPRRADVEKRAARAVDGVILGVAMQDSLNPKQAAWLTRAWHTAIGPVALLPESVAQEQWRRREQDPAEIRRKAREQNQEVMGYIGCLVIGVAVFVALPAAAMAGLGAYLAYGGQPPDPVLAAAMAGAVVITIALFSWWAVRGEQWLERRLGSQRMAVLRGASDRVARAPRGMGARGSMVLLWVLAIPIGLVIALLLQS